MIKQKLDEYLEFDSNLLFNSDNIKVKKLVRIFGGAIRDIIAGQKINDIDILVGSKSCLFIEYTLEEQGYIYMESLAPKDLSSVYKDIRVINEPRTWLKGTKIVQLIKPVSPSNNSKVYREGFIDLIQNVDLSCCGVSWDGDNLFENYPDAILHCISLVFDVNYGAKMYSRKRSDMRRYKLIDRGWKELNKKDKSQLRDLKIDSLLNTKNDFDFVSEYKSLSSYTTMDPYDNLPF